MLEKIRNIVTKAKTIPNSYIEYNCELPLSPHITADSFYGIKAVNNPRVPKSVGVNLVYKM